MRGINLSRRLPILAAVVMLVLAVGCSNNNDEVERLRKEVDALKAATPAVEQPIVLNRLVKPLEQQGYVGTQPFCVTYRLAGTSTERCRTATYYLGSGPVPDNEFWKGLLDTTKRINDCYNAVRVGDVLPDCWR